MRAKKRLLSIVWALAAALMLLAVPRWAGALAVANSTIGFSNLSITPSAGVVTLDGPWLFETFAHADNSLGETASSPYAFGLSPGTTSAAASVTWANGSASASAKGDPLNPAISGTASASVDIPGCGPAAAFGNSRSTFQNFFTLSGGGNNVDVGFSIDISGALNLLTDACGVFAFTETVFTLEVDGTPGLFDHRWFEIGPSNAYNPPPFSLPLSGTIKDLVSGTHFLLLQAETDPRGRVPEPPSLALLLIAGLAALTAARSARRRSGKQ